MKLSQVKWENINIGDKVKCNVADVELYGVVSWLDTTEEVPVDPENSISIDWNNGSITYAIFHSWLDKVEYLGRK